MTCPNCGSKINPKDKYCDKCGAELNEPKNLFFQNADSSAKRKGIKKFVKTKTLKPLIKANAYIILSIILIFAILYCFIAYGHLSGKEISIVNIICIILSFTILIFGNVGIFGVALDISRGKHLEVTDIYKKSFKIAHKIIVIFLMAMYIVIRVVGQLILFFPNLFILKLLVIACIIYILPNITTMIIILMDNKYSSQEKLHLTILWNETQDMLRGRRIEYYGLIFSFAGWLFLEILIIGFCLVSIFVLPKLCTIIGLLILAVLYIVFVPYLASSIVNLYRSWLNEETFESSKGISNILINFLTISIIIIITLLINMLIVWLPKSNLGDQIMNYIDNLDYDLKAIDFEIGNGKNTITIIIPEGYKLKKDSDANFKDLDGEDMYVHYSYSNYLSMEENYKKSFTTDQKYKNEYCTYNFEEFELIINNQNVKAYNVKESCESNRITYEVKVYYPVDKEKSLEIWLISFDHPIQKEELEKFVNIKPKN